MADIEIIQVEKSNDPMGIKIENNKITFYIPKVYRKDNNEISLKKNLLKFVCSLSLANAREYADTSYENELIKGEAWPVNSFLWIIRDYLENGIYYNRDKQISADKKGKIDWKKTLKTIPIISEGNIIYGKTITSKMASTEDLISQIYKICLKISIDCFGWAFSFNIPVDVNRTKSISEMIYIIKNEMGLTFDDMKKMRYKHMLAILQGVNDKNISRSEYVYTIINYYYVFETMVDMLLQGIKGKEKQAFNPKAKWTLDGVISKDGPVPLRPDTVYKKNSKEIYIIDSKMYQFGFSGSEKDLPGTGSIQKQVTYGEHAFYNVLKQKGCVNNAFILPYNRELALFADNTGIEKYMEGNIAYIGFAEPTWRTFASEQYNKIHTILIDFNYLLENYDSKTSKCIEEICSLIDKKNVAKK